MYAANLSWNPTQNVLSKLLEQGLIQEFEVESGSRTKKRYDITEKGINVLRYFEGANELIDVLDIFS